MDLVNTECGIDDYIMFGSLASPYSFIDAMYKHLSAKKHTVSELTLLKKLGYRHNEMIAYLSAMNYMSDVFSATADMFKGHIYKC